MNAATTSERNLWPSAIIGCFALFIGLVAAWIVFAVRQNMDLVRPDYYEEEIRFQRQLDRLNRTQPFRAQIAVTYDRTARTITVTLPAEHALRKAAGLIRFYRPSDARLDHEVPLDLAADGHQRVDARELRPGLWKVNLSWETDGEEYFFTQALVLANSR